MRARAAKQRFPVSQWVEDLTILQMTAVKMHRPNHTYHSTSTRPTTIHTPIEGGPPMDSSFVDSPASASGTTPVNGLSRPSSTKFLDRLSTLLTNLKPQDQFTAVAMEDPPSQGNDNAPLSDSTPNNESAYHSVPLGNEEHDSAAGEPFLEEDDDDSIDFLTMKSSNRHRASRATDEDEIAPTHKAHQPSSLHRVSRATDEDEITPIDRISRPPENRQSAATTETMVSRPPTRRSSRFQEVLCDQILPDTTPSTPDLRLHGVKSIPGLPDPSTFTQPFAQTPPPLSRPSSTLSIESIVGAKRDFSLQKVDPFFTDSQEEYYRAFEKKLGQLSGKTSENQLCIQDYLTDSEKEWFNKYRSARLDRLDKGCSVQSQTTLVDSERNYESVAAEENNDPFDLGSLHEPPRGVKKWMQLRIGDWPVYSLFLAFGQSKTYSLLIKLLALLR